MRVSGTPHPTAGRIAWLMIMAPTVVSIILCVVSIWRISHDPDRYSAKAIPVIGLVISLLWIPLGLWILFFGVMFWENFSPG